MGQKVRMAVAIVVLTEIPEFWETLGEFIDKHLPERAKDIQVLRSCAYGIPVSGTEDEEVRIEFEEEPSDQKIQEATDSKGE